MAQRRMFSLAVIDTDRFLDMPASAQSLYFHLGMRADDEGFVSSPRKITILAGCAADDLKLLAAKGFIIPFESGICIITDWKQNNYIQSDRFKPTVYIAEKDILVFDDKRLSYRMNPECIQGGYKADTQVRIGKDSIGKTKDAFKNESSVLPSQISSLVEKYADQGTVNEVFQAIASTRKSNRIADSKKLKILRSWEKYSEEAVIPGIKIFLSSQYHRHGKREEYLLGIIKNVDLKLKSHAGGDPEKIMPSTGSIALDNHYREQGYVIT